LVEEYKERGISCITLGAVQTEMEEVPGYQAPQSERNGGLHLILP
jgi:hypothetical protein